MATENLVGTGFVHDGWEDREYFEGFSGWCFGMIVAACMRVLDFLGFWCGFRGAWCLDQIDACSCILLGGYFHISEDIIVWVRLHGHDPIVKKWNVS